MPFLWLKIRTDIVRQVRECYVFEALKTIPIPPGYSLLTKNKRRSYKHIHSLLDKILQIAAGSTSKMDQLQLLKVRWRLIHKTAFKENVSWTSLGTAIETLPSPKKHSKLSSSQKKHGTHSQRVSCLAKLIEKIAMTDAVEDHIKLTSECLASMHKGERKVSYLSASHLPLYFQHLKALPAFEKPLQPYEEP